LKDDYLEMIIINLSILDILDILEYNEYNVFAYLLLFYGDYVY
jgi:hypothetical protein